MFLSDEAITKQSEDLLNRKNFVERITKSILDYKSNVSFSIGIYGKWGSGKTSVLNMIIEQINKQSTEKVIVMRFNPWLCVNEQQLTSQFFRQLRNQLGLSNQKLDVLCNFVDKYADTLEYGAAIPTVGNFLPILPKLLQAITKKYFDKTNKDLSFIRERLIKEIDEQELKIIIAIDDIDRLSNEEIQSIFQLVKSLGDFPNTIYLLAFDYDIVVNALNNIQKNSGAEYLEKIIQVPLPLPNSNIIDIRKVLFTSLDKIIFEIPQEEWDVNRWSTVFHRGISPFIKSIRDVKRYVNCFEIKYRLLKNEIDVIDLLAITCLQVFLPDIYKIVSNSKEELCGGISHYSQYDKPEEKIKNYYSDLTENLNKQTNENLMSLLTTLFPKLNCIDRIYFGTNSVYNEKETYRRKAVCNSKFFDRYFRLVLSDNDIDNSTVTDLFLISSEDNLKEQLINFSPEKTLYFLENVRSYFYDNSNYRNRREIIFKAIVSAWDKIKLPEESFFSTPKTWQLLFCIEDLLNCFNSTEKEKLFNTVFSNEGTSLDAFYMILLDCEHKLNRFTEEDRKIDDSFLKLSAVIDLEKIFISRVVTEICNHTFLDNNYAGSILLFLEKLDKKIHDKTIVNLVNKNNIDDIIKLVCSFVSHGNAISEHSYETWNVELNLLEKYINIDTAYNLIIDYSNTEDFALDNDDKRNDLVSFLLSCERKSSNTNRRNDIVINDIKKRMSEI